MKSNKISEFAIIEDGAIIGDNVEISPWVFINKNSVIGNDVKIFHHSVINNSKLGEGTIIGQFTLVREVETHKNVIIGPHSEVARTTFHDNSSAYHKATIIDSTIKEGAKIGPNFITANYDFIKNKKFNSIIEKNAKIGGNVTILAPITIGESSIIGANSFINKDVPNNTTVFNKKERIEKAH